MPTALDVVTGAVTSTGTGAVIGVEAESAEPKGPPQPDSTAAVSAIAVVTLAAGHLIRSCQTTQWVPMSRGMLAVSAASAGTCAT